MIGGVLLLLMHLTCEAAFAQGAVDIVPKVNSPAPVTQGAPIRLYGASKALVIGIDNYGSAKAQSQGAWPRLAMAVKDAEAVAKALADQGFKVTLRKDLPAAALDTAFRDFFLSDGADPEARLLVWFAGHGHTISGEGYLVPADAPHPETHDVEFRRRAISLRRFGEYMREARAKHVLAVFDSCFAGTVFNVARSGPPPAVSHSTALPVRQFVTSGEAEQQVSDDGTFRKLFIDALKGLEPAADANGDGYITGTELGQFLFDKVTNLSNRAQTPRFGKLNALGYDRGDFVLQAAKLTGGASRPSQSPSASPSAVSEAAIAWEQVKSSTSIDVLEAFVRQFSSTVHAALARDRIDELRRLALVEKERVDALKLAMKQSAAPPPQPAKPDGVYVNPFWDLVPDANKRPGEAFRECQSCPVMTIVPAGRFSMGSELGHALGRTDEQIRPMTIAKPFAVGKFEVTLDEWLACVIENGCSWKPDAAWERGRLPASKVSWSDVTQQYLPWLSKKTGRAYRLLTEAEWEYAARGGSTTEYAFGDRILATQARFASDGPVVVGSFLPNSFGLHDMHGNVAEFVQDWLEGAGLPRTGTFVDIANMPSPIVRGGSYSRALSV